ncbi:bifunctional L-3-cyanoalanine synthase/cysteine synthase 1, mitochondrial [Quercus suber]|uniref:bifunctional L-3-cyanoalanine synthase/cysteine synthase 1, mitochondrial n=1 Tax=Quercus suber TaxID=58331 RepID=UPI0032DE7750
MPSHPALELPDRTGFHCPRCPFLSGIKSLRVYTKSIYSLDIAVKQEMMQPTASIKDRAAHAMIVDAEKKNLITPRKTTDRAHVRNMGISMAFISALKGYKTVLTMPSYTSLERRVTMRAFDADLILTDPTEGMGGTVKKAYDLLESTPNAFMLQQFSNPANTLIYGVEPAESNVLNGGKQGPHQITGNGVWFKPNILDMDVMEKFLEVSSKDAVNMARELALKEGLMTIHPSFRERYLPSVLFQELKKEAENMQPVSKEVPIIINCLCPPSKEYMKYTFFKSCKHYPYYSSKS